MFTYTEIENACNRLGIDPKKIGKNPFATAKSIYAKDKPANLKKLGFPEEERDQVEKIGQIINNLSSQLKFPLFFDLTNEEGKLEKEMDDKINKFLSVINQSLVVWFEIGAQKALLKSSDFSLYNGLIYQINKEKMNKEYPSPIGFYRIHPGLCK